ncbi:MAG: hypothetical protein B6D61_04820 [Bacteroidetes bacterium 4484_249]|nr:MAG: hypothetical protein B6D61_04820 [Bacteroidetes bacterium 4484_249]
MNKSYLLIFILIQLSFYVFGQTAELKTDKKHSVEIKLSTSSGSIEIPDEYYEFNDSLFFAFQPKGDWDFKKSEVKDFKAIKIKQAQVPTFSSRVTPVENDSKDITHIIIAFSRKEIDITKPFEFFYEDYVSSAIQIPEQHWAYYSEFNNYYNSGKALYEEKKYVEAFEQLQNIIPGAEHHLSYTNFSSYNQVYDQLVPDIISTYLEIENTKLLTLQSNFNNKEKISGEELAVIKTGKDSVILINDIFEPYYRITEAKNIDLRQNHEKLISDYTELYTAAYNAWRKSSLKVIENGFYDNENKYEIYIELIARLLVYTNHVEKLSKYDSIDISLIANPSNEISFFKYHIDILNQMSWKDDFITILELLNEEISANSRLIGQTHLLNLRGNMPYESQPNYYVINAFNELAKGKFEDFKQGILLAMTKCTDKEIMYYLELWHFSYRFKNNGADENLLEKINAGLEYEKKYMPTDAIKQYEMAKRMGTCALPPFLIGRIKLEKEHDIFPAERFIKEAINIYPGFALARIYELEMLIENKEYDNSLTEIEAILNIPNLSIWYIQYLKARILFLKEDYKGSLGIIESNCMTLNSNNLEQYILLGDNYLGLKDCPAAKENYQNAGDIQPDNPLYKDRMLKFITECNN